MKDVQRQEPDKKIEIERTGVRGIKIPITLLDKKDKSQNTVAEMNVYVNLPESHRGTHMSRFIEILNEQIDKTLSEDKIDNILLEVMEKLDAEKAHIEIEFPYFIKKTAPVSKKEAIMDYKCRITRTAEKGKENRCVLEVQVPIMTVCPCSKEISERGAHNQRGTATVKAEMKEFIWIEELITIAENAASSQLYPLLKREDEKYVTENSYDRPRFVEDVVREIAHALKQDKRVGWFEAECENQESIHGHNAYACVARRQQRFGQ